MGIVGAAFTMYPVTDVQRSATFYRDTLGLRPGDWNESWWVEFGISGSTFGVGNVPDNGRPGTAQSLVLEVQDLAAFCSLLATRGVTATLPVETPYGCSIARLEDPDGNIVWLHEKQSPSRAKT
jgi:catechol 2,3-dioxygenase-like lactoylglutathione lyase family enzyme